MPTSVNLASTVVWNGYIYEIISTGSSTSVEYAPINSNGTIGSWTATSASFPESAEGDVANVYDGYIYEISAFDTPSYYAQINNGGPGTIASWNTDSSNPLPQALYGSATAVYNGYIYILGGDNSSGPINDVYYAPISSAGLIGSWTSDTSLSTGAFTNARAELGVAVYNGYLYIVGGGNGATYYNDVQYAALNSNGSLSAPSTCAGGLASGNSIWCEATSFTTARVGLSTAVYNGNLYILGGQAASSSGGCTATGDYCNDVQYDSINANGSLGGTWNDDTSLSTGAFTTAQ